MSRYKHPLDCKRTEISDAILSREKLDVSVTRIAFSFELSTRARASRVSQCRGLCATNLLISEFHERISADGSVVS